MNTIMVAIMLDFRPMISLNLLHRIMNPDSCISSSVMNGDRHLTGVCDQVSCNNPTSSVEAMEVVGNCDQRRADDGNFDIDQVKADHQSVYDVNWFH